MSRELGSIEQTQALLEQANYVADRALSTTLYLALKMQRRQRSCAKVPAEVIWLISQVSRLYSPIGGCTAMAPISFTIYGTCSWR